MTMNEKYECQVLELKLDIETYISKYSISVNVRLDR
jgi:hypothetical protein